MTCDGGVVCFCKSFGGTPESGVGYATAEATEVEESECGLTLVRHG